MKFTIPKQLVILTALAVFFAVLRVVVTDSTSYLYMIWNLFLAFVAFGISGTLLVRDGRKKVSTVVLVLAGIVWLLFFPNAPYVVTDLIHMGQGVYMPRWYDAVLLFTSAWAGMLMGMYSLWHMEQIWQSRYSRTVTRAILGFAIVVSSFGIYLGRFLRWNSWDVIASPPSLWSDITEIFSNPAVHAQAYAMTIVFSILIAGSYYAWKSGRNGV